MTSTARFSSTACHRLSRSNFVCVQCGIRAPTAVRTPNPSNPLPYTSRRHNSFTDNLRKKIWGTDTPPGPADPYGKEGIFDRKRRERGQQKELESAPEQRTRDPNEYVRATTTEGLEMVGGPGWGLPEWKADRPYQGFMEPERTEDRNALVLAVHRALVETYALKEAGLPLVMDYYSIDPTEDYAELVAVGASFEQDEKGQMTLVLESEELRRSILECVAPHARDEGAMEGSIAEEEEGEENEQQERREELDKEDEISEEKVESKGAEERPSQFVKEDDDIDVESEGSGEAAPEEEPLSAARLSSSLADLVPASNTWRHVSLEDAAIKFAVLKRVMQLTGRRIPDPDISIITTPSSLLVHLIKKPKPKKIAETLLNTHPVAALPNVQIKGKRYGPIDREVEVGRWKLIEEELERRGLPVTG